MSWNNLITTAWRQRQELVDAASFESFRIFHGYAEGRPGIVIEKFGTMAVIDYKIDIREELLAIKAALLAVYPFSFILAKGHQSLQLSQKQRCFDLHGSLAAAPRFVKEYGRDYHIKADATHSVGLYLDARPVRLWLQEHSSGRRVLNLFAFTGSLGVAAAAAGAAEVVHLDKSKDLLPRIKETYAQNELRFDERSFLRGDIYKHLPRAIKSGQKFGGIILDPPPRVFQSAYAEHKTQGQDFPGLVRLCSKLLAPGAWLLAMFHRFDVSWDQFEGEVLTAAGEQIKVSERFTSDIDFPEANPEHKLRVSIFEKTI